MCKQDNCTFNPKEYHVFGGLDVDKKKIAATFISQENFLRSLAMPNDYENLIGYVKKHYAGQRIAFVYEAGPTGYGLYDGLRKNGYVCLLATPSMIPRAPGERVKTNRLDSLRLAEALRAGQIRRVRVPEGVYRDLRHLVQLRESSVRRFTSTKLQIKSLLLFEGIAFPAVARSRWSKSAEQGLKVLSAPPVIRYKLDQLMQRLQFHEQQVQEITRHLWMFCQEDCECKRCLELMTGIPGIGRITAMYVLARMGDWRQLRNSRELGAFLGLVPRESSTGERTNRGTITAMGDPIVRSKLVEAAWRAIRVDQELKGIYDRVYRSNPPQYAARKAVVAIARKLTGRIYSVLVHQRPYQVGLRPAQ